jgi:hypothetical protein
MKGDVASKTTYQEMGCTHKTIAAGPEGLMPLMSSCVVRAGI